MSTPGTSAPSKFPQRLEEANPERVMVQRLSWIPAIIVPVLVFWSYTGAFHHQPGYERAGYISAGISLLLAIALGFYEFRRRQRRAVLCLHSDMVGIYRAGIFCYAFPHDQLTNYELHPFNTKRLLLLSGALAAGSLIVTFFSRKSGAWDLALAGAISLLLCGVFVSAIRSRALSQWFYVPTGKGKSKLMFFKR